jgi:AAA ATPase domain
MRLLWNRWERATSGDGQVVFIAGEAGIGKSRLVRQFRERLAGTPHTWNECSGASYFQNTATAHYIAAWLQIYLRTPDQAESSATQALGLAEQYGFPQIAAFARITLGRACASLGHSSEGVAQISRGLSELAKTGNRNTATQLLNWLAEAQALDDATTEALANCRGSSDRKS